MRAMHMTLPRVFGLAALALLLLFGLVGSIILGLGHFQSFLGVLIGIVIPVAFTAAGIVLGRLTAKPRQ